MSKVKSENFIVIQGFMVNEMNLKGNELLIYAVIYGFSQTDNQTFTGSLQYLADWTNSTKQGVMKNLKSLVEKGFIEKNETFINGVKFCEYNVTKFNGVLNNVEQGMKQSLMGGGKQSLIGGIKQSLPNNIGIINNNINKIEDNKEDKIVNNNQYEEEFNVIWSLYPRKQGKSNAIKSYIKARKKGVTKETIYNGLNDYINYIKIEKIQPQYIKQGSTWFNQECWNDDYTIKRQATTKDIAEHLDFSEFR